MSWIDVVILAIIGLSVLIGLVRGFIKESISLATWIAAIWVAVGLSDNLAVWLPERWDSASFGIGGMTFELDSLRVGIAFILLLIAVLIVGAAVNFLVGWIVKRGSLTTGDRFFGIIFGLARGAVIVTLLVMAAGLTEFPKTPWWQQAGFVEPFQRLALWGIDFLPPDVAENFSYGASAAEAAQS